MKFYHLFIKQFHIKFDLTIWENEKLVWLNNFIIPEKYRRNRIGTVIMEEFCKWLDENKMNSKLLISNCYGTPEDILIKFYSRFNYNIEEKKTKNIYMIRNFINA